MSATTRPATDHHSQAQHEQAAGADRARSDPGSLADQGSDLPPKAAIWSQSSSAERDGKRTCTWPTPASANGRRYSATCSGGSGHGSLGSSSPDGGVPDIEEVGDAADVEWGPAPVLLAQPAQRAQQFHVRPQRLREPAVGEAGVRRRAAGDEPPTQMGGRGELDRSGPEPDAGRRPAGPGEHRVLLGQPGANPAMASSVAGPRWSNAGPIRSNSSDTCPAPTPQMIRPPDRTSRVANSLAARSGWRRATT